MKSRQLSHRLILKLGTNVVVEANGSLARKRLEGLAANCIELWRRQQQLLIVSSGAVGLGNRQLRLGPRRARPLTLTEKQACAAVGQPRLMDVYQQLFRSADIETAQILVTAQDFSERTRYLSLRQTLEKLLALRVIPIINENDVLSTMELDEGVYAKSFGDNDKLSALVAAKLDADLLVLLTDVDGLHEANPQETPEARKIDRISSFDELSRISTRGHSREGRGGMAAKLEAARVASISGVTTIICSGLVRDPLRFLLSQDPASDGGIPGTLILASTAPPKRQQWIGLLAGRFGVIRVNRGASEALLSRQASLLPVGVTQVEGEFREGQVVSIVDEQGEEIGRGISSTSSRDLERVLGLHSSQVQRILGEKARQEVVHRDDLVLFREHFATATARGEKKT